MLERGIIGSTREQRFDQSSWRIFPLQRGAVVITESGQQLLAEQPVLLSILREYRKDVQNQGKFPPTQRRWFRPGGNSDVFLLGNTPVVIKESSTAHSTWFALDRMDYLYSICKSSLPSYVRVPEHYGAIFSADLDHQYLIMRKANEGITIEDIKDSNECSEVTKVEVVKRFDETKVLLDRAIERFNTSIGDQRNLLPDWHEGNVIVDFSTPTQEYPFTFWVIDQ